MYKINGSCTPVNVRDLNSLGGLSAKFTTSAREPAWIAEAIVSQKQKLGLQESGVCRRLLTESHRRRIALIFKAAAWPIAGEFRNTLSKYQAR